MIKKLSFPLYVLAVSLIVLELLLRMLGYRPYRNTDFRVVIEPPSAFTGDDSLGIALVPGTFAFTLNDAVQFEATHTAAGHRLVVPAMPDTLPAIAMLGCSFTYGYGVDDAEHFSSLLQAQYPQLYLDNFGVPGYGTVQSLLQLEQALMERPWEAVVVVLSSLHPDRNALTPSFRRELKVGFHRSGAGTDTALTDARFPYADASGKVGFVAWNKLYQHPPLREWSALVNAIFITIDHRKAAQLQPEQVTAALLLHMDSLCRAANTRLVVAALDHSDYLTAVQQQVAEQHVAWVDLDFDFSDTAMTNAPYDSHPNAEGHQYIAAKLAPLFH